VRNVGAALVAGLRAPVRRVRLAAALWLFRLVPVLLLLGLPAFEALSARTASHPDAGALLDPAADGDGFAWAFTQDFFRAGMPGVGDRMVLLAVLGWLLVAFLAGGITSRLVHAASPKAPFLEECGRYAGRFLRLALVAAALAYLADVGVNALLKDLHDARARLHATQEYPVTRTAQRGLLFLAILHVVGALHAYARIDVVANERRSALSAFARAFGTLLVRFPSLLLVELGMIAATGAAALVAWVLLKVASPLHGDSGWIPIGLFLGLAAFASYLRSGVEVGVLEARCRMLHPETDVPPTPPPPTPLATLAKGW
jgi:hypothetical protein